ncbi:PPK2 family (PPK2) (PDB:3CZP) [Commensalibacter communis]|uniref:PPK2 family polyphosphate kinase n=1 Tax=Commensalibacter communis TaxID=2972786 RepID=UPI0022FF7A03|nr:PPK2 family polyphosphate kinase [Commensalibacter communis]CAI3934173.1 PPK2 family (PPK2) (PDB:3CZP) [Commensalibacter communis]CAI3945195.1 PPK2 family (PPK2) (PDB:3CZP) [Commensalibacter communis]CAI3945297.1 PPK2 family (PPK2) (PDB:3CZP) [Commensalibacter communis]CAI3946470.1 PPK2 family (PPK2) (PDB:3CZP) [Commensalibacter communis]
MVDKSVCEILRSKYKVEHGKKFKLSDYDPSDTAGLSLTKKEAKKALRKRVKRLCELQELLYANDDRTLVVALQGMDTSGKDGTIKHVTSGVNPQGIHVASFKQPGPVELAHDYLWRIHVAVPPKGKIGIFNRSHYEEVLVTKIHSEVLEKQRLPEEVMKDKNFWKYRYEDICNFEAYLHRQGYAFVKIFLNISKEEQRLRLLSRLDRTEKQWKFSPSDPKERKFWDQYQEAYQEAIEMTATPEAPWFVVPANNKWFARLVVVELMIAELEKFEMVAPKPNPEILASLNLLKAELGGDPDHKALVKEKKAKKIAKLKEIEKKIKEEKQNIKAQ